MERAIEGFMAKPFLDVAFGRIGKEMEFHMRLDQPGHALGKGRFLVPAQQDGFGQFCALGIVAVIGIAALMDAADTG